MIDPIWAKGIIKTLVLPPTGLLLLSLLGLSIRARFFRAGSAMAWSGVLLLLVLSIPAVGAFLVRTLDTSPPFDMVHASEAQALVILGGGTRRAAEYGGDTLGELTLERVRYGAYLAHLTHLPVLVSGGTVNSEESEATLMRGALEREFGVAVRWSEDRSRTTHENATNSAAILRAAGVRKAVLVAHSFDMSRARSEFAAAGIETFPAPTGIPATEAGGLFDYLPGIGGLRTSYYAIYEILANLVLWTARGSSGQ